MADHFYMNENVGMGGINTIKIQDICSLVTHILDT